MTGQPPTYMGRESAGRIPPLEVFPYMVEMKHVVYELRGVEHLVNGCEERPTANYIITRLVTILETTLRHLSRPNMKDKTNVEIPIMTLRTALEDRHGSPDAIIKRMLALSVNYQNLPNVTNFLAQTKPVDGRKPVRLTDDESSRLDELFKKRHRITHSIDELVFEPDQLREYYELVSGLVERIIEAYWSPGLLWAKADVHDFFGERDEAVKCYQDIAARLNQKTLAVRPDDNTTEDLMGLLVASIVLDGFVSVLNMFENDARFGRQELRYMHADVLIKNREFAKAGDILHDLLVESPNAPHILRRMVDLQLQLDNPDAALEYTLRMLGAPEQLLYTCNTLASVYEALGQNNLAGVLRKTVEDADESTKERILGLSSKHRPVNTG